MATQKSRATGVAIRLYLEKYGISQQVFADRLRVSQGLVSQWVTHKVRPSPKLANKIIHVTAGEVSREDLYPELFEKAA